MMDIDMRLPDGAGAQRGDQAPASSGRMSMTGGMIQLLIGACLIAFGVRFSTAARWIFGLLLALVGVARCGAAVLFKLMRATYPQISVTEDNVLSMTDSFAGGVFDIVKALMLFVNSAAAGQALLAAAGIAAVGMGAAALVRALCAGGEQRFARSLVLGVFCLAGGAVLAVALLAESPLTLAQMLGALFVAGGMFSLMLAAYKRLPGRRNRVL